jgi:hypothetical protein
MPKHGFSGPLVITRKRKLPDFVTCGQILTVATDERLAALEERVTRIDKRLIERGF